MNPETAEKKALTVSEYNTLLRVSLEKMAPELVVEGEISEIKRGKTGHVYFVIKDKEAQASAVMWAGTSRTLGFQPGPGQVVICYGRPTVYQQRGSLQLVVHRMVQGGEGMLRRKFLELKTKLEQEGYFHPGRKRALPFLPKAIGIVTSAQGAVIHDIMVKVRERMPSMPVFLVDVRVQGEGSTAEIAAGIRQLSESAQVDVIIVARGGGSLEDLWAFNEEVVVKAIFAATVPVVSGVGHEVDFSLADFAADMRAPTPTAAAEMVVPHARELLRRLTEYERRLADPESWLLPLGQRLDDIGARLDRKMASLFQECRLRIGRASEGLRAIQPQRLIESVRMKVEQREQRLQAIMSAQLANAGHRVARLADRFEAVHPRRVLSRGFSLVECEGKLVSSADAVQVGDAVTVTLARGSFGAAVTGTSKNIVKEG